MFKVLKSEQKVVEGGLSIPEEEHHKHPPFQNITKVIALNTH